MACQGPGSATIPTRICSQPMAIARSTSLVVCAIAVATSSLPGLSLVCSLRPGMRNGCRTRVQSQGHCSPQVLVLESAGHAVDLGGTRTDRLCGVSPGRCHHRNFLDDRAGLSQRQREELRGALEQIERTGALVKIDVGCQNPRFKVSWDGIEIVDRRERP